MTIKRPAKTSAAADEPARRKVARYGWVPDLPDHRDFTFAASPHVAKDLPPQVDLRAQFTFPVFDQGRIGSCTANAIAGAIEFGMIKEGHSDPFTPSRLFIYYNERAMEGHVAFDAGAQIRDGIKSVAKQGVCREDGPAAESWPYDDTPPEYDGGPFPAGAKAGTKPPRSCYTFALKHKVTLYQSVAQNLADMKGCLASGFPFVYGFTVYESFESDAVAKGPKAGWVPMPGGSEAVVGGHAVLAVGYDDDDRVFICRNSWADTWGAEGYFYMPYAYLIDNNLSSDFWTIRVVK